MANLFVRLSGHTGCLTLLEICLNFFLLEILEYYWNFTRSPGNFMVLWQLSQFIWCNDRCRCRFSRCYWKNRIDCVYCLRICT